MPLRSIQSSVITRLSELIEAPATQIRPLIRIPKSSIEVGSVLVKVADLLKCGGRQSTLVESPLFRSRHYHKGYLAFDFDLHRTFWECSRMDDVRTLPSTFTAPINTRYLIEFGSPNIAKPLHPGHMRSLICGSFISRLLKRLDVECRPYKLCYFGDWGKQFAIVLAGLEDRGNVSNMSLGEVLEVYVQSNSNPDLVNRADRICALMEVQKDPRLLELWRSLRTLSIDHCERLFKRFSVEFDSYDFESDHFGAANSLVCDRLLDLGLARQLLDRSVVYFDDSRSVAIRRSDHTSLYLSRDIAAYLDRRSKHKFDRILYVCDTGQRLHFERLLKVLQDMQEAPKDWTVDDIHIGFGKILNFRTRSGPTSLLENVLDDATKVAREAVNDDRKARILATTHLIINDCLRPRSKPYTFSLDQLNHHRSLAFRLHYCHARLCSLLTRTDGLSGECFELDEARTLVNKVEIELIHELLRFADVCQLAYVAGFEAHILTQYVLELCSAINRALRSQLVVGENDFGVRRARFHLFRISRSVVGECMRLLGVEALDSI